MTQVVDTLKKSKQNEELAACIAMSLSIDGKEGLMRSL